MAGFQFFGGNAQAYNSRDRELLLWGPAGTGKSLLLLTKCLTLLGRYPGVRGLFCRGTRASLTQSGLVTWENHVLGPDHPVLTRNPVKRRVRQSYEFANGSELIVAGLDDPGKTLSTEYDFVYVQEATEEGVTLDVWETLTRSLRNGRMNFRGTVWHQLMADCNPSSPFHFLHVRGQQAKLRMVRSDHRDNPRFFDRDQQEWTDDGRLYIEGTLAAMTGIRRKRFYEGVWSAAEGLVYEGFIAKPWDDPDEPGHLLPAGWTAPAHWRRVWGIDWGDSAPTSLVLCAEQGDRAHFYREVYRTRLRPDDLGRWAAREVLAGREVIPETIVTDHDAVRAAEFERGAREEGCPLRVRQADKRDRLEGISAVQSRFDRVSGFPPRIYFRVGLNDNPDPTIENGPNGLIAELVGYKYDPNALTDRPDPRCPDHAMDAMRYVCRYLDANPSSVMPAGPPPPPIKRTPWDGGQARRYGVR